MTYTLQRLHTRPGKHLNSRYIFEWRTCGQFRARNEREAMKRAKEITGLNSDSFRLS